MIHLLLVNTPFLFLFWVFKLNASTLIFVAASGGFLSSVAHVQGGGCRCFADKSSTWEDQVL